MVSARQHLAGLFYKLSRPTLIKNMHELQALQWQAEADIIARQHQHMYQTLNYAQKYVPYYQKLFKETGFQADDYLDNPAILEEIPLLTKSLIRDNKSDLVTTSPSHKQGLYTIKTGGTTGEPLWFVKDPSYYNYNIAHDFHVMTWSGWSLGQPQYWLWGHVPDNGNAQPSFSERAKDWLAGRFNSNAFILSPESMMDFARTLQKNPGGVLWSYVSTAYRFAQFVEAENINLNIRAVYTAAEPLFDTQRQYISRILKCPVFNNYSSIDTGDIASECQEHNGLHILTRNCYVEVVDNGKPVPDGQAGEFVLTTLTNYGMPLIRYKIEDWGKKSLRRCPCGRGLPLLEVVEGRKIDLFKTRDGRSVYGAFAKDLVPTLGDVKQFQVVQKSLDLVVFRIVHSGELNQEQLKKIERVSKAALGETVEIKFEYLDHLPATPTGKHRYLISEVA